MNDYVCIPMTTPNKKVTKEKAISMAKKVLSDCPGYKYAYIAKVTQTITKKVVYETH